MNELNAKITDSGFYTLIPFCVDGRNFDGMYDAGDNALMLYWEKISPDSFDLYSKNIEGLGFEKYQAIDNTSMTAATYVKENVAVHLYYLKRCKTLRVISQKDLALPTQACGYKKTCDVAVTQLGLDYSDPRTVCGMGYLVRLEDGSFIVIDGGWNDNDAKILYDLMLEQKPDEVEDLVIAAWVITHAHIDHCGVYNWFAKNYRDKVTVKMLIGNDPTDFIHSRLDNPPHIFAHAKRHKDFEGCVYAKVHTGQTLFFPGISMNILYSHEDVYPNFMLEINGAATIAFDVVVNSDNTRFFFLADVTEEGAGYLVKMYEEDIKCDVLQIGHHGNKGGSYELYRLCAPRLAFWPTRTEYPDRAHIVVQPQNKWIFENVEAVIRSGNGNYTMYFGENK